MFRNRSRHRPFSSEGAGCLFSFALMEIDGRRQKVEEVALLFSARGQSCPQAFVISLDSGFDDVDQSFVALASASANSATRDVNFAISFDCKAICLDFLATNV
jgi:hypothetical protein